MAFSPAFLDELAARNPIEEVVGQYVNLTRKGSNLFGLCPFHSEKTASFSVAPDKQIFYCFGCHKGGGVVQFIMEEENLDFPTLSGFWPNGPAWRSPMTGRPGSGLQAAGAAPGAVPPGRPVFPGTAFFPGGRTGPAVYYETGPVSSDRHPVRIGLRPGGLVQSD